MNSDLKKQYAMRITQANNVQMIIISYEIIETYLDDALNAKDNAELAENADMARKCIEEVANNLHYEYEIARTLKEIYLYMKKQLRHAVWDNDKNSISEVKKLIKILKDAYTQIADQDDSSPLMQNTQSVMTGITYGRNQILDELSQDAGNRGYRV